MVDRSSASSQTKLFLSKKDNIIYQREPVETLGGILNLPKSQNGVINSKETFNIYNATTIPSTFLQGN